MRQILFSSSNLAIVKMADHSMPLLLEIVKFRGRLSTGLMPTQFSIFPR